MQSEELNFSTVDSMAEPDEAVLALDLMRSLDGIRELKEKGFQALSAKKGEIILDLGCGTGEDVVVFAKKVGQTGKVVGTDCSEVMIRTAQSRQSDDQLSTEYVVSDAHALKFADNSFNAVWCDRILQHVEDPFSAIKEIYRVLIPGGRAVLMDADWGTLVIDHPDRSVTRTLVNMFCDAIKNGWMGRQLYRLCQEARLNAYTPFTSTVVGTDIKPLLNQVGFGEMARAAFRNGLLAQPVVDEWINAVELANEQGGCVFSLTLFGVMAEKPGI